MKLTYKGTLSQVVSDELESEKPTDLSASTCDIQLIITGQCAAKPPVPAKTPGPKKPGPKKPSRKNA
jgi:hypothetical protein